MKAYQDVFRRYEKKYLLSEGQYAALRRALQPYMQEDQYGKHTICNVYFDTPDFYYIRQSIEKPLYKEKLRLRSYGVPESDSPVFVELKKKYNGVVYKRRAQMPLREAEGYLCGGCRPRQQSQILCELDWFLAQSAVAPQAFIGYDRVALFGREDPALRVTFDTGVRARDTALELACGDWGSALTGPGQALLEIKLITAMPLWLSRLLSQVEARPASFSKYGAFYQSRLAGRAAAKGGIICA